MLAYWFVPANYQLFGHPLLTFPRLVNDFMILPYSLYALLITGVVTSPHSLNLQVNNTGPDVSGPPYPDCFLELVVFRGLSPLPGYKAGSTSKTSCFAIHDISAISA